MPAAALHALVPWVIPVVLFAWWRIDVELNPYAPCRYCQGSGRGRFSRTSAFNVCEHGQRRIRAFAKGAAARHDARRRS